MLKKIVSKLESYRRTEGGAAELVNALIIIPIVIVLIFSIFNVGSYFLAMSQLTETTQNYARMVAIYGGENSAIELQKNNNKTISTMLKDSIYSNGKCTVSTCLNPPTVKCTEKTGIQPGSLVSCEVTYTYQSMLKGLDFGISGILEQPRTIKQTSVSETWGY